MNNMNYLPVFPFFNTGRKNSPKSHLLLILPNASEYLKATVLVTLLLTSAFVSAQGYIEMPDTTDVPEYERESMLKDLDIPAVRDRDPDPQAGPRLNVTAFRLQGIVEFPELGITLEGLKKQVENIRFEMMEEDQKTISGFSENEIAQMTQLVVEIEKETPVQHVGPLEVQKFVFLVRDMMRKRGATLGMIETVADTITQYYRERGFILAKAFIPKQEVRDGVVTLTLLLGELGEVAVEDANRVSEKLIKRVFKKDLYQPVTHERIDESLYLINDIPGVRVTGVFSPGSQVGDTLMTVKVLDEKFYTANFRVDNHGSENTSENRAYADIYIHDPFGIGDELYIGILNSFDPDSSTYGSLRYNNFLGTPRWRSSLGVSTNDFVSRSVRDTGVLLFTGESTVADASISYQFKRSRVKNFSTELKYMNISTTLDSTFLATDNEVNKITLGFNFDVLNEKRRQMYLGNFSLHSAEVEETDPFQGLVKSTQQYVSWDASMLSFYKLPFTNYETRFLFKTAGQYAGEAISNLNQINLTGPTRAKGFAVNGFQSDDGIYLGADWIIPFPDLGKFKLFGRSFRQVLQPYLFADAAHGVIQKIDEVNDVVIRGTLVDYGAGLRFNFSGVSFNVMAAKVVTDKVNGVKDTTPTSSVFFDLQYSL
ncbi:Heme/hemopexin transporter protein HuxB [Thalassocella blandensis]|nr:Heme/hemopexin transporter protein HuxB [Thalassocella blandensis]